jgi:hypothetical protein
MPRRSNVARTYPANQPIAAPQRLVSNAATQPRPVVPQRKYTVTYMLATGQIGETSTLAPATPAFEDAFGALGRGTILQSLNGPIAVEDLFPGDKLRLADGSFAKLLWRGMMTIMPTPSDTGPSRLTLTRIMADALGIGRPMQDLVLGPSARLHHGANGVLKLTGKSAAFIPARDFVDGNQFVELRPAAAVDVYQLGFATHETLMVNGIGVESLHPGTAFSLGLRGETLAQYLALFPHLRQLEDVGLFKHLRMRLRDLEMLD